MLGFDILGNDVDFDLFVCIVTQGVGHTKWPWPRGQLRTVSASMSGSAQGPNGLTYAFLSRTIGGRRDDSDTRIVIAKVFAPKPHSPDFDRRIRR